jgi:methionine-rich copper-binding protein CopC
MHQIYNAILIVLGLVLLGFGAWDLLVPRARFVNSNPPPGAMISEVPSVVTVNFSNKLHSDSKIDVTSTAALLPSGETEFLTGGSVVTNSEIDPTDESGRTLRANVRPGLHRGLYYIKWTTKTAGWRTITNGETSFGVGMNVPEHVTKSMGGPIRERNYDYRGRRAALLGGFVLLALALLLKFTLRPT